MSRDASYNIRNIIRNPKAFFFEQRRGTTEFFILWIAAFGIGSVVQSAVGQGAGTTIWFLLVLLGFVPLTHSYILARLDFRSFKRLASLAETPTAEGVRTAFEKLDASQPLIRRAATDVLANVCAGSPGKLVKALEQSPETIIEKLLKQLETNDTQLIRNTAICLRWLSRDHPELCTSYAKLIAKTAAASEDAQTQQELTLALGLIAKSDPQRASAYAKLIAPAVKDPDADVRSAAATALQQVPTCDPAEKLLHHLSDDPAPTVQQAVTA
ncbi:HEAT repeat domain-containing protein [Halorientalis salina]|uniref:HEAT repeat domain-containing protein n=1 Tax=Halorientalis salina TaxID=2932266 RepID=UPI002022A7D1|nr:HEAT repeat domain-containing protein [Halorientalis salina]